MYPIIFSVGSLELYSWHLFYVLGATFAYFMLQFLTKRWQSEISNKNLSEVFIVCYVTGYFGARLLSIIVEQPEKLQLGWLETLEALVTLGPMTFYGGFLLSISAGYLYARVRSISFAALADVAMPSGFCALVLGRIGCFLNGDDYGKAVPTQYATSWWSIKIPVLKDDVARYPVQVFEAFLVFLLVTFVLLMSKRIRSKFGPGAIAFLIIVSYSNLRFLLEFLRDDFRGTVIGPWLSTSQFLSLLNLAFCGVILIYWTIRRPSTTTFAQ